MEGGGVNIECKVAHPICLQQVLKLSVQLRCTIAQIISTHCGQQFLHDCTGRLLRHLLLGEVINSGATIVCDLGAVQWVHDAAIAGQVEAVVLVVEGLTGGMCIREEAVFMLA